MVKTIFLASAIALLGYFPLQTKFSNKWNLTNKWLWTTTTTVPVTSVNCLSSALVCTKITIVGDPDSGNPSFSGKADPSIAKDPNSSTYFMSYSWVNASHGAGVIDTHIASSTDAGVTWNYVGDLYPTQTQVDTISGNTVYESNEVSKILPIDAGGGITDWMVCTYNYWKPGAGAPTLSYSQRLGCAVGVGNTLQGPFKAACTTIVGSNCTVRVTPQWLGTNTQSTTGQYPIDVNMQTLSGASPALDTCTDHWREPTAILDPTDGKLVLSLQCNTLAFQPQFVTNTAPTAGNWVWSYITGSNSFGTATDASDLCSHTGGCGLSNLRLTEFDFSVNNAGTGYGTTVTIASLTSGRYSTGAVFAELDMSSRPYTFKKSSGLIIVDVTATSSDSLTGGPGSSTYSPVTSMILTHKTVSGGKITDSYPMFTTLHP